MRKSAEFATDPFWGHYPLPNVSSFTPNFDLPPSLAPSLPLTRLGNWWPGWKALIAACESCLRSAPRHRRPPPQSTSSPSNRFRFPEQTNAQPPPPASFCDFLVQKRRARARYWYRAPLKIGFQVVLAPLIVIFEFTLAQQPKKQAAQSTNKQVPFTQPEHHPFVEPCIKSIQFLQRWHVKGASLTYYVTKWTWQWGWVHNFLRVPLACLGSWEQGSRAGTPMELS